MPTMISTGEGLSRSPSLAGVIDIAKKIRDTGGMDIGEVPGGQTDQPGGHADREVGDLEALLGSLTAQQIAELWRVVRELRRKSPL